MQKEKNFFHRHTQLSQAKQALLEKRLQQLAKPSGAVDAPAIGPRPPTESIPLSFAQQRLWFLQQLEPESAAYNEAMAARLQGPFNREAFARMVREVLRRHEVLRCRFPVRDGQVIQVLDEQVQQTFEVPLVDLRHLPGEQREGEMMRWAQQQMQRPFDLQTELPWRTFLLRLGEQ